LTLHLKERESDDLAVIFVEVDSIAQKNITIAKKFAFEMVLQKIDEIPYLQNTNKKIQR